LTVQLGEDFVGGLDPGKGLQRSFQLRQDQPMAAVRSVTMVKSPRRSAWRSDDGEEHLLGLLNGSLGGLVGIDLVANGLGGLGCRLGLMGLLACGCHRRPPFVLISSL